jgi:hypothetical protein
VVLLLTTLWLLVVAAVLGATLAAVVALAVY